MTSYASPFPGMDPYLEDPARWPGVHQSLMTYLRDAIQPHIRPRYTAVIAERPCGSERVYVATQGRNIYPDVFVVQRPMREQAEAYGTATAATPVEVASPWIYKKLLEPRRVPYIEILQHDIGEVVTVIEVLSPVNKVDGDGRDQYLKKQAEILSSRASLVEIDLLGVGLRVTDEPRDELNRVPFYRYIISVNRADREYVELYPLKISERLPRFRIPLRSPDADVVVDLQAAFNRCYDNGAFADLIDYSQPPPVLLSQEERAWAQQVLQG